MECRSCGAPIPVGGHACAYCGRHPEILHGEGAAVGVVDRLLSGRGGCYDNGMVTVNELRGLFGLPRIGDAGERMPAESALSLLHAQEEHLLGRPG